MPTHSFYLNDAETKQLEEHIATQPKGKSEWLADLVRQTLKVTPDQHRRNALLEEYFTCPETGHASKVKDLPCVEDPELTCRNQLCQNRLKRRLGID